MKTCLSILLLCSLFAGCSKDDEVVHQPYLPKYVRQVRITENGNVRIYDFRYDAKGRIGQCIEAGTRGSELLFTTTDYVFSINKVFVDQSGEGGLRQYVVRMNNAGNAESLDEGDKTLASYLYNDNGYYYERQSNMGWKEYAYLMKGEYCNVDKITVYYASTVAIPDAPPIAGLSAAFEYKHGTEQTVNLDLSWFFTSARIETPLPVQLFGWMGKRSQLPSAIRWTQYPGTSAAREELIEYSYTLDREHYITQIDERKDGKPAATYEITYR